MLVICRHRETIGIFRQTQSQFCPGRCPAGQGRRPQDAARNIPVKMLRK